MLQGAAECDDDDDDDDDSVAHMMLWRQTEELLHSHLLARS